MGSAIQKNTREQHFAGTEEINKEVKTKIKEAESQHGCQYSILLNIPYFDPIDFTAIDSMHNLSWIGKTHI